MTLKHPKRTLAEFPALVRSFARRLNAGIDPNKVSFGSIAMYWWRCAKAVDHVWQDTPNHRTRGRGCPFCAGKRISDTNRLSTCAPALAREWHPSLNDGVTAADVMAGYDYRAWWKCPEGPDHEWQAVVSSRVCSNAGCPFCRGNRASVTNSLQSLNPALAKQWHPSKNRPSTPRDVTTGTPRQAWWRCGKNARHVWRAPIANRALAGTGCPQCAGIPPPGKRSVADRRPDLAAQWHPTKNGTLTASDVTMRSTKRVWWKCPLGPDHEWHATPARLFNQVGKCPFCSNDRLSITNCLATVHPAIAADWHPTMNGSLTASDVIPGTHRKVWWRCKYGHSWDAIVNNRTSHGSGCPRCARPPRARQALTHRGLQRM